MFGGRENGGLVPWKTRRSLAEGSGDNSSLILAAKRTHRKDPSDGFSYYTGGWNISNGHYWAVSFSKPLVDFPYLGILLSFSLSLSSSFFILSFCKYLLPVVSPGFCIFGTGL